MAGTSDALAILAALQHAGLPVTSATLPDLDNPRTWAFTPPLNPAQRLLAILIVAQLRTPPVPAPDLADLERRVRALEARLPPA